MYTFEKIVGQDNIKEHVQSAIGTGKISHAYIIDGEKGMGKKLLANTFAKTIQCEKKGITPCNECVSCKTFDTLNHPDTVYVKPSKKTGIGVGDIREQINGDIHIKPYHYPYKVYIIDEADTMTEQAQNALLKTIEEPPPYAVILLLSRNVNRFLPTILSRCVVLKLKPVSDDKMMAHLLQAHDVTHEQARLVASFSQGNMGKGMALISSKAFLDMRDQMIDIVNEMIHSDDYGLMVLSERFDAFKDQINDFLDLMMTWFRDLLLVKKLQTDDLLINGDKYKTLLKQAQVLSYNEISVMTQNIHNAKDLLRYNSNYRLVIEMMLLQTKENS